ncbi:beta-carotene isomerase D27, chloroplastic-like [Actinidia eriantha]|uniref:beta-carotene isomerase D27, chloroplastic-like n=1 Tax=Actinidia eriantha TaxID=165200 RepID=UPI00258A3A6C|nr:beta-carotene isomerase D27, chloroplastic-like [Actinidia eriantha]
MEATLALQHRSPFSTRVQGRRMRLEKHSPKILYTLTRPTDDAGKVTRLKSIYKDNWFDLIAINHISQSVQTTTGLRNNKSGYESFVEAATEAWHNFNPIQQHEIIIKALEKAFPRPILAMIRTLLPNSKFAREYFAVFTTVFFTWLVGPNEVRESELNGQRERNVVHIHKCRFLEESNCVGMCINLCKLPSQTFIKDSLGVPVNMVPNFDDMSCEMIFGQDPPATSEDPAFKQPCYKLCKANKRHSTICSG